MGFQSFKPTKTRGRTVDNSVEKITMRNNGMIHFNTRAYETMGKPDFVTFLFDPENTNLFAIQAKDEKVSKEYILSVRQSAQGDGFDISSQTFMEENNFLDGNLREWRPSYDSENQWYVCDFANPYRMVEKDKKSQNGTEHRQNARKEANALTGASTK
jgi:hypothetical protein